MKERSKNPATKQVAKERIGVLFIQAKNAFHEHPERSNRYVPQDCHAPAGTH